MATGFPGPSSTKSSSGSRTSTGSPSRPPDSPNGAHRERLDYSRTVTANLGDFHLVLYGALGSLVAGLGTGVGAIFILLRSEWSGRSQVKMLAFAAGVMLAASIFSLLLPALDLVGQRSESVVAIAAEVAAGLGLGALAVWAGNRWIPHEHFIKGP